MCSLTWSDGTNAGKHFATLKTYSIGSGDVPIEVGRSSIGRRRLSFMQIPRPQLLTTRSEYEHLTSRCEEWFDAENIRRLAGYRTVQGYNPAKDEGTHPEQRDLPPGERQQPLLWRDTKERVNGGRYMAWAGPVFHMADMKEHHDLNSRVPTRPISYTQDPGQYHGDPGYL